MGIVVIGAVFVDIKGYPLSTYIPGGRNAGRMEQVHGGVSRNVAEDIANVELRPTFVSLVDDSGMGQDVIDKLENHKVNTRFIKKVPDGMGTWLAIFDNRGEHRVRGAVARVSRPHAAGRERLAHAAQAAHAARARASAGPDPVCSRRDMEHSGRGGPDPGPAAGAKDCAG